MGTTVCSSRETPLSSSTVPTNDNVPYQCGLSRVSVETRNSTGRVSTSRLGGRKTCVSRNRKQTDVKPLFVFEGVVNIAMCVPISLGDSQNEFSTNVFHHIVKWRLFTCLFFGRHIYVLTTSPVNRSGPILRRTADRVHTRRGRLAIVRPLGSDRRLSCVFGNIRSRRPHRQSSRRCQTSPVSL